MYNMYSTLYKKADVELPYNIDTRMYKWVQEGETKQKYEQKWVVFTEEANSFIEQLPHSYEGLSLQTPSREDRGPLTIVSVTYGDSELNEDYVGEGEITWWTLSSGVYTFHVKKWVTNTPDAIKAWCEYCMNSYGYEDEEVSVDCSPVAGEPRVMCHATFTPDFETNEANDPTTGEEGGEEEEEVTEEAQSISCSSQIDVVGNTKEQYAMARYPSDYKHILEVVDAVESGRVVYRKTGDFGGRVKYSGWYSTDDTNPNALDKAVYMESTAKVAGWKASLEVLPDILVPSLRVTVSNKLTSQNMITPQSMSTKMLQAGTKTDQISSGGFTLSAPAANMEVEDTQGNKYKLEQTKWLYEGCSYDVSATKARKSYKTGKIFYEGTCSESWRTTYVFYNDNTWD